MDEQENSLNEEICERLRNFYTPISNRTKVSSDDVTDTSNYHGVKGDYEPIKLMEYFMNEYVNRGLNPETAMNLCMAIKYIMRIGTKDEIHKEMFKAENYIHRARTKNWIPKIK